MEKHMADQENLFAELEGNWNTADEPAASERAIPDGRHQFVILDAGVDTNEWGTKIYWRVNLPDLKVNRYIRFRVTPNSAQVIRRQFRSLGMNLSSPGEIPGALKESVGLTGWLTKKSNGDYENFYFNKVTNQDDETTPF